MNDQPYTIECACYLTKVLDPGTLRETIDCTVAQIRASNLSFDAIAFSGLSGVLVAPTCCIELKKFPVVVRRKAEGAHSSRDVEGLRGKFNYIIVDDLIATGKTIARIEQAVAYQGGELVGIFCYNQSQEGCRPQRYFNVPSYFRWFGRWTNDIKNAF